MSPDAIILGTIQSPDSMFEEEEEQVILVEMNKPKAFNNSKIAALYERQARGTCGLQIWR